MNKFKRFMQFFEGDDGGGGGGAGSGTAALEAPTPAVTPGTIGKMSDVFGPEEGEQGGQQQQQQQQQQQKTDDKPPVAQPTAAELTKSIVDALKPAAPVAPTKQYTPEELDKMFNVWKPSPELVTAIREGDPQAAIKAMVEMRDGMLKQFHTLVNYQIKVALQDMEGKFAPALQTTAAIEADRQEKAFFTANEDLKDHTDLVRTVFQAMRSEGTTFKDAAEASKAVADRARKLLGLSPGTSGASGEGRSSPANNTNNGNNGGRPANLTGGSQASGQRGEGSATRNPPPAQAMREVFL